MKISNLLFLTALALSVTACGGESKPVPRPRAFHRIEIPAATYDTLTAGNISLLTNSAARVVEKPAEGNSQWIDITYPGMGNATVYCSITEVTPATASAVTDNRLERMALNSGGHRSEITEFDTPSGFSCRLMTTPAGTATPVQFLAVGESKVVSGVLMVNVSTGFRPDSIAPVVEAVGRDMITLMTNL